MTTVSRLRFEEPEGATPLGPEDIEGLKPSWVTTRDDLNAVEQENLLGDVSAQTADPSRLAWPPDEIAIRFHHRLVSIHPFPNGNGRHARLAADLLVTTLGQPRFSWGANEDLVRQSASRRDYLAALRIADREFVYEPLLQFARS